jgi:hypothetical protein
MREPWGSQGERYALAQANWARFSLGVPQLKVSIAFCPQRRRFAVAEAGKKHDADRKSDYRMARAALARIPSPPSLIEVASQADTILQARWPAVERVAFELAARRRLSHSEFLRCLSRW